MASTKVKNSSSPHELTGERKSSSFKIDMDTASKKSYLKTNSLNLEGGATSPAIINPNLFNARNASFCSFDGILSSPDTTCAMAEGESLCAVNQNVPSNSCLHKFKIIIYELISHVKVMFVYIL